MKKVHVLAVAALLGFAAILGVVGATRTTGIGAANKATAAATSSAQIAARGRQLRAAERQLAKARRDRPPALPRVPAVNHPSTPAAAAPVTAAPAAPPAAAPRVVYHRPAPIVVVRHLHHGDDGGYEHDHESEAGDD